MNNSTACFTWILSGMLSQYSAPSSSTNAPNESWKYIFCDWNFTWKTFSTSPWVTSQEGHYFRQWVELSVSPRWSWRGWWSAIGDGGFHTECSWYWFLLAALLGSHVGWSVTIYIVSMSKLRMLEICIFTCSKGFWSFLIIDLALTNRRKLIRESTCERWKFLKGPLLFVTSPTYNWSLV